MSPALIQLIAVAGPQVVGLMIDLFKTVKDKNPDAITPEQWTELRGMFSETYEERKARITQELKAAGSFGTTN